MISLFSLIFIAYAGSIILPALAVGLYLIVSSIVIFISTLITNIILTIWRALRLS